LPPDELSALEEAQSVVVETDGNYTTLLAIMTGELDAGSYGQVSS